MNVKSELAGKVGVCPKCGVKTTIPTESVFTSEEFRRLRDPEARDAEASPNSTDFTVAPRVTELVQEQSDESKYVEIAETEKRDSTVRDRSSSEVKPPSDDKFSDADVESVPNAFDVGAKSAAPARRRDDWFDDADDPLQDPNVVWCVQTPDNRSYGPAPSSTLKTWIQEKRISPEMFVWREGWERWEEAGAVFPEVRRIFELDEPNGDSDANAFGAETNRNGSGAAFASLAEAARSLTATRRIVAEDEANARRRRNKARQTFGVIAALTGLVVVLSGVLVYVLFFR